MNDKNLRTLLVIVGLVAVATVLVINVRHGALLAFGRPQFFLLLLAFVSLALAPAVVRRSIRLTLERSRQQSPATRAMLRTRPGLYWVYALWFASVVTLGEAVYWTYTKEISHFRVIGFQYLWRIPLGYACIFGGIALAVFLVARRRIDRDFLSTIVRVGTFVAIFAWLPLVMRGLSYWAVLIVAVGAAVQAGRAANRHADLWHRLVVQTAPWAALLVVGLGGGFYVHPLWSESQALSRLPPVSSPAPNVLLIVLDTVRAESLSLYGYDRATTPNLEQFARRGVVFDRAFSTAPWTLPSHGSMFTGRLPHELSTGYGSPLDGTYPTLAEALGKNGYLTAGFVANTWYGSAAYGLSRGFVHYEDSKMSTATAWMNTSFGIGLLKASKLKNYSIALENAERKTAGQVNRDFTDWLAQQNSGRPFFAFLNYCDSHQPYLPPESFATRFSATRPNGRIGMRELDQWSEADIREFKDAYDNGIAYMDDQLGRLFAALDRQNVLENTIVIVTSDHGEQFGEHGLVEHVASLYLPLLHVPLVVVFPPRIGAADRSSTFVSLRNLPATVLDLAGLADSFGFPGRSLVPARGQAGETIDPPQEKVLSEVQRAFEYYPAWYPARKGRMESILFGGLHYIKNYGDGREELYDVTADPHELRDLSQSGGQRLDELRALLNEAFPKTAGRTSPGRRD